MGITVVVSPQTQVSFFCGGNMGTGSTLIAGTGRIILRAVLPAAAAVVAASLIPLPAVCGDNPSAVTESSRTYKDPVCNFMVKNLENEIAETTTSLKNCGDQFSAPASVSADKVKECAKYERKLKLTKANLIHVREQCDKGLTPDSLPKVADDPDLGPCSQCGADKPLPKEPSGKVLTGLPLAGNVSDLKAGEPDIGTVLGRSAAAPAAVTAGIPEPPPTVDCQLTIESWKITDPAYAATCDCRNGPNAQPVCGAVQPPTEPPAGKPGFWAKVGNFFKTIGNWVKSLFSPKQEGRPLTGGEIAAAKNVFGDKIDYSKVKLVTTGSGEARTSGHTIYIPGYDGGKWDQGVLLHEMTHIYQRENYSTTKYWWGKAVDGFLGIVYMFNPENVYKYELDPNKSFRDYRLEQQAAIVRDYFYDYKSWGPAVTSDEKVIMRKILCGEGLLNSQVCGV